MQAAHAVSAGYDMPPQDLCVGDDDGVDIKNLEPPFDYRKQVVGGGGGGLFIQEIYI